MTTASTNPNGKSAQISMRIPPEIRPVLAQAAALQNTSIGRFIFEHGYETAQQVVEQHDLKYLHSNQP